MADTTITLYGATGVATVTPRFDFPSGTVKVYVEDIYVKDLTSTVHDSIALAVGEKLQFVCSDWNVITRIDLNTDKISGDISSWTLPTALTYFRVDNTSVSGDISGWVLPAALQYFYVSATSVSGDISGWSLPSTLLDFYANVTSVSGNISGWSLPSGLVNFRIYNTSVTGNISGWTLPSTLTNIYMYNTTVSGDISGWSLPSGLMYFRMDYTSVSGDISDWVLPSGLIYYYIGNTSVSGDISGWVLPSGLLHFYINTTSVSGDISEWVLPSTMINFYVNATSVSGDISGWVLPSTLVLFYVNNSSVSGDITGWVLPSGLVNFFVNTTSLSGNISGWELPSTLAYFYAYSTSISGNVSNLVLPSTLQYFLMNNSSVDYDSSSSGRMRRRGAFAYLTTAFVKLDLDDCNLTYQQVDNVLADCVLSNSLNNTVEVGGSNNKPPTIEGLISKAILEARGWLVNVKAGRSIPMYRREPGELWVAATNGGVSVKVYSRGELDSLVVDDSDLTNAFTNQEYTDVAMDDETRVAQTSSGKYAAFLFKDKQTQQESLLVTWQGQTDIIPSQSTVYLQVYNRTTGLWETLDSDSTTEADTDFELVGNINTNLDDYFDTSMWVSCRVYQEAK